MTIRPTLTPPRNLILGALLFLIADVLVFRCGLYERIAAPRSLAGVPNYFVRQELARRHGPWDVLIIGDSAISEGMSPRDAESAWPSSRLHLVVAGIPDISTRATHYLLHKIDPHRDRYRMIVFGVPFYEAYPEGDSDTNSIDIDILSPVLGVRDYADFIAHSPTVRYGFYALTNWLLGSVRYADDFQDLLRDPGARLTEIAELSAIGDQQPYLYEGHTESMQGISYDPKTRIVHYPPRIPPALQEKWAWRYQPHSDDECRKKSLDLFNYRRRWISRIISDYRQSSVLLVFFRLPKGPIPQPHVEPCLPAGERPPSLAEDFQTEPGVRIIDEDAFTYLERPEYFWDMRHLNRPGRQEISKKLLGLLLTLQQPR